jgi:hypothetical protein
VSTLTSYRPLHALRVPTMWLVLLVTLLLALAVVLASSGLQRAAASEQPAGGSVPHPAMSGDFAKLPFA